MHRREWGGRRSSVVRRDRKSPCFEQAARTGFLPISEDVSLGRTLEPTLKQERLRMRNLEFQLDWVFDGNESQAQVFDRVARDRVAKVRGQ